MLLAIVLMSCFLGFIMSRYLDSVSSRHHNAHGLVTSQPDYVGRDQCRPDVSVTSPGTLPRASPLSTRPVRIVVAMTGATGAILGIEILKVLRQMNIETHLIISHWAIETIKFETSYDIKDVKELASRTYNVNDATAPPSSGSFQHDGMIVVPCSMKTLSAIRSGYGSELISRAADVTMKEQRKLVLCARETPLSVIHLENMLGLARLPGVVIAPPMPAFYTKPKGMDDVVAQSVGRLIDALGLPDPGNFPRWKDEGK